VILRRTRGWLGLRLLVSGLALLWLGGCDDTEELHDAMQGKWEITDPGGDLLGGTLRFYSDRFYAIERRKAGRGEAVIQMNGTYELLGHNEIRWIMEEGPGAGSEREGTIRVEGDELRINLRPGSVVYRRVH